MESPALASHALSPRDIGAIVFRVAPCGDACPRVTLKSFSAIGSGMPTGNDCSGSTDGQCSVTFSGTVKGSQIGKANVNGTLSVNHSDTARICLDSPDCNDQCFPASGTGVITTKNDGTITFGQDGLICPRTTRFDRR